MKIEIPRSLKQERDELHETLARVVGAGGKTAEVARGVAKALHPHFLKEEAFALPPLGLLSALAAGEVKPEMTEVLEMTARLKSELPEMLKEHQTIVAALEKLREAAHLEENQEANRFAEQLTLHARMEEEVFYPCAILIGEYLRMAFPRAH